MKQPSKRSSRFPVFAEQFKKLRGDMTDTDFAKKIGLTRQTIGFYCNGERIPDALTLRQIAEECNISVDWLLGLSPAQSRDPDVTSACRTTGLSEKIVIELSELRENEEFLTYLNTLFIDDSFCDLLQSLFDCQAAIKALCAREILRQKILEEELNGQKPHELKDKTLLVEKIDTVYERLEVEAPLLCNDDRYSKRVREQIALCNYVFSPDGETNPLISDLWDDDPFVPYDLYKHKATECLYQIFSDFEEEYQKAEEGK